jgi:hypothetical protein
MVASACWQWNVDSVKPRQCIDAVEVLRVGHFIVVQRTERPLDYVVEPEVGAGSKVRASLLHSGDGSDVRSFAARLGAAAQSQVVHTIPRGGNPGAAPPITVTNVPPIADTPPSRGRMPSLRPVTKDGGSPMQVARRDDIFDPFGNAMRLIARRPSKRRAGRGVLTGRKRAQAQGAIQVLIEGRCAILFGASRRRIGRPQSGECRCWCRRFRPRRRPQGAPGRSPQWRRSCNCKGCPSALITFANGQVNIPN